MTIPESNDDPVFVLAQNSAGAHEINAKNSNTDNDIVDRIMCSDTIDLTTPTVARLAPTLWDDRARQSCYPV